MNKELKVKGLKKASGATENYGPYDGRYNEIFYDLRTGEVWAVFQYNLGQNTWTEYHDDDVIKICNTTTHMTMKQLSAAIHKAVELRH